MTTRPKVKKPLTQEALKRLLSYEPETGHFRWRINKPNMPAGSIAGTLHKRGYLRIGVLGAIYRAHRLAWFYVHGAWPARDIDHMNGIRTDNRLANLREATPLENAHNRGKVGPSATATGFAGVGVDRSGRFFARITVRGKRMRIGMFDVAADAANAYAQAKRTMHPAFVRDLAAEAGCTP